MYLFQVERRALCYIECSTIWPYYYLAIYVIVLKIIIQHINIPNLI